jgi:5-formyltetrahydrofolate cyclo-ligase
MLRRGALMAGDVDTQKRLLRQQMLDLRTKMPLRERLASDAAISRQVEDFAVFKDAGVLFVYVSTAGEVDTQAIIEASLKQGKRVCVPRCEGPGVMRAYEIGGFDDLKEGSYGILEPRGSCPPVASGGIELALVPCMACTLYGQRLGYGGGFYDRYLRGRTYPAAALCRNTLLLDKLPAGEYDVPVDIVITESSVIAVTALV